LLIGVNSGQQKPEVYCKRLVGLPSEHLKFQGGQIYVNDQLATAPVVVAGQLHASAAGVQNPRYSDGEDISLGPDEIFLIGDNVNLSRDSRMDGPSKHSDIVGVVDWIYWPAAKMKILR
jgi:signal peptidase I